MPSPNTDAPRPAQWEMPRPLTLLAEHPNARLLYGDREDAYFLQLLTSGCRSITEAHMVSVFEAAVLWELLPTKVRMLPTKVREMP